MFLHLNYFNFLRFVDKHSNGVIETEKETFGNVRTAAEILDEAFRRISTRYLCAKRLEMDIALENIKYL